MRQGLMHLQTPQAWWCLPRWLGNWHGLVPPQPKPAPVRGPPSHSAGHQPKTARRYHNPPNHCQNDEGVLLLPIAPLGAMLTNLRVTDTYPTPLANKIATVALMRVLFQTLTARRSALDKNAWLWSRWTMVQMDCRRPNPLAPAPPKCPYHHGSV
jgi:hypothetical protein